MLTGILVLLRFVPTLFGALQYLSLYYVCMIRYNSLRIILNYKYYKYNTQNNPNLMSNQAQKTSSLRQPQRYTSKSFFMRTNTANSYTPVNNDNANANNNATNNVNNSYSSQPPRDNSGYSYANVGVVGRSLGDANLGGSNYVPANDHNINNPVSMYPIQNSTMHNSSTITNQKTGYMIYSNAPASNIHKQINNKILSQYESQMDSNAEPGKKSKISNKLQNSLSKQIQISLEERNPISEKKFIQRKNQSNQNDTYTSTNIVNSNTTENTTGPKPSRTDRYGQNQIDRSKQTNRNISSRYKASNNIIINTGKSSKSNSLARSGVQTPKYISQNSKYIVNSPIHLSQFSEAQTLALNLPINKVNTDCKTQRKQKDKDNLLQNQKSAQKNLANSQVQFHRNPHTSPNPTGISSSISKNRLVKINNQSADYYKYWKTKANQYQEENFNLHRLNSTLQENMQILKHKLQRAQKKLLVQYSPEQPHNRLSRANSNKNLSNNRNQVNYQKLQNYYRTKIDQMSKKISEQQLLIKKQDKKIRELSNFIAENYQLKNILDNMQEKFSEMRSVSRDSKTNSFDKGSYNGDRVGGTATKNILNNKYEKQRNVPIQRQLRLQVQQQRLINQKQQRQRLREQRISNRFQVASYNSQQLSSPGQVNSSRALYAIKDSRQPINNSKHTEAKPGREKRY